MDDMKQWTSVGSYEMTRDGYDDDVIMVALCNRADHYIFAL